MKKTTAKKTTKKTTAKKIRVITEGRTDLDELFRLSYLLSSNHLNHTPFIAFVTEKDSVRVRVIPNRNFLLELPDDTPVMAQWQGQWRSDFFQFKVSDVRNYIKRNQQ